MSVIQSDIPLSVKISDYVYIGKNVVIGEHTRINSFCNIYGAIIGENCMIGTFTEIQSDTFINDGTRIQSHSFIPSGTTIGKNCFIGHNYCGINDTFKKGIVHYDKKDWSQTIIEENVIIGNGCVVFPVIIGQGSIIGAGSVVTKDIPAYSVAYGNPCVVKYNLKDKK